MTDLIGHLVFTLVVVFLPIATFVGTIYVLLHFKKELGLTKVDPMIWVSIGYIALVVLIVKVFGN